MGAQLQNVLSQVELNKATAKKTEAEAEKIAEKVRRIVNNNEPITDGAPIIFTEKKHGVLPEYNIRTDSYNFFTILIIGTTIFLVCC